jgi:hypothetical protein
VVSTRSRIRLTDQALVAVKLARVEGGERASAVDLLRGLAAEPDGAAGQLLRDRASAVAALVDLSQPPALVGLDVVLLDASAAAAPRPVATLDLLYAALDAGGDALERLLTATGWEPADLRALPPGPAGETLGLGADPRISPLAATAVARTRAAGGGAVELLYELAEGPDVELSLDLPDARPEADPEADAGLEAVLAAARTFRPAGTITATDLVRAAIVSGGHAPRELLEAGDD